MKILNLSKSYFDKTVVSDQSIDTKRKDYIHL